MVLGALIRVIFGAIVGFVVGFLINWLLPSLADAITNGIYAISGNTVNLDGQIIALMTGLGFLFGLLGAIAHEMRKG